MDFFRRFLGNVPTVGNVLIVAYRVVGRVDKDGGSEWSDRARSVVPFVVLDRLDVTHVYRTTA